MLKSILAALLFRFFLSKRRVFSSNFIFTNSRDYLLEFYSPSKIRSTTSPLFLVSYTGRSTNSNATVPVGHWRTLPLSASHITHTAAPHLIKNALIASIEGNRRRPRIENKSSSNSGPALVEVYKGCKS
ncbi:unnamed protein product [Citrullus colocynthis]|uniref:Secreted protein n=1 Tax=Citrullus colocynthis TaxID=252529 RepID=A0ABP0YG94_9ROSI